MRTAKLFHGNFSASDFEKNFCNIFPGLVEGMDSAVETMLTAGPVYCLSNTNEMHLGAVKKRFPILERFTKIFASHELRKRKPYPGIYREVANTLGVHPQSLVFFDDVEANVYGAERAGLEAHLFQEANHFLSTMQENPKEAL
jgi:FMN phosphatase YigB (HAD superfamily)